MIIIQLFCFIKKNNLSAASFTMTELTSDEKREKLFEILHTLKLTVDDYVINHIDHFYDMYINGIIHNDMSPNYIATYCVYCINDYTNAEKYYKLAADNGEYVACNNYAHFLCNIKKDYNNSDIVKYYKLAADNGEYNACCNYAYFLCNIKKEYDNPDIVKYYKLAANNGDYIACNNYASFLCNIKKEYDNPDIVKYYKLAADNGIYKACTNYASFLKNIKNDHDNPDIVKYYKLAANNGDYIACNNYAMFLKNIKNDHDNPDIEKYLDQAISGSIENVLQFCNNYVGHLTTRPQKHAEKTEYYRQHAYETGWFNYIYMLSKLSPKPYFGELVLYTNKERARIQWRAQRRVETLAECPICYNTTGTLYRYACTIHMYCCTCYRKMQHTQKCCAQCRMKEHPDYAAIFD
jgi:TPR repeat protein